MRLCQLLALAKSICPLIAAASFCLAGLLFLALSLKQSALALLSTNGAAPAQPVLPMALSGQQGAFDGIEDALLESQLVRVILALMSRVASEARLLGDPDLCARLLTVLDAPRCLELLCGICIANEEAERGARLGAVRLVAQLAGCAGDTWRLRQVRFMGFAQGLGFDFGSCLSCECLVQYYLHMNNI